MHLIHIVDIAQQAYLENIVQLTSTSAIRPGLRSAGRFSYRKPTLETTFWERPFSYAGPAAWNSLPHITLSQTLAPNYLRQLKTFLYINLNYVLFAGLLCIGGH